MIYGSERLVSSGIVVEVTWGSIYEECSGFFLLVIKRLFFFHFSRIILHDYHPFFSFLCLLLVLLSSIG